MIFYSSPESHFLSYNSAFPDQITQRRWFRKTREIRSEDISLTSDYQEDNKERENEDASCRAHRETERSPDPKFVSLHLSPDLFLRRMKEQNNLKIRQKEKKPNRLG